ncbi:MAG: chalcone isomerase family protein [Rhodoferax sp.]
MSLTNRQWRRGWSIAALLVALQFAVATATATTASAVPIPTDVQRALPATQALGQADLKFWGFAVYKARLWVAADFQVDQFDRHTFGLELVYARALEGRDIVARSMDEMNRMGAVPGEQAARWREGLARVIPSVLQGERLLAIHRPSEGLEFLHNGKSTGTIRDAAFARRFLDIWLSTSTSEPQMRRDLLTLKPL